MQKAVIVFTPVPGRCRRDVWSPELQQRFIEALAGGAGVSEAARRLGKNRQAAYALRRRAGAESFARAWDAAANRSRPPAPPRPILPLRRQAEASAERGYQEVCAALEQDAREAARAALTRMLDGIYGPKVPLSESDSSNPNLSCLEDPNFPNLSAPPVAFEQARLKRGPC
jgi:transposase-like protein